MALLSPVEVAGLCADPTALVADARPADRFAEGHVVGAIHLPCTSSQGAATAAVDLLAARKMLVVYGEATEDALLVAEEMRRRSPGRGRADCRAGGGLSRLEPRWARLRLWPVHHLRRSGGGEMTAVAGSRFRRARAVAAGVLRPALRAGLGLVLVVAAVLKLRAPQELATEIANYHLLPGVAPYLGATLPTVELVVGLGLLFLRGLWTRAAALAAFGLFTVFAVAVGSVYLRGINVACGCFGGGGGPISGWTVARNLTLLAASAILALGWPDRASPRPQPPGPG